MVATRKGIYHNLKESKYMVSNEEIMYFFSSELYLSKFLEGYEDNRERMKKPFLKLWNSYTLDVGLDFTALHDLLYYRHIEKRGFRVVFMGEDLSWQNAIKYALRRMIEPNIKNYHRMSVPSLSEQRKILESTCRINLNHLP